MDDPDFVVDVHVGDPDSRSELKLSGSADTRATGAFRELLAALHHELVERRSKEIVLDMYAVDAMVSSCFKELVGWVAQLQELPPEQRYRIRLRSNPQIVWQKHGLRALSCFDTELIAIEG